MLVERDDAVERLDALLRAAGLRADDAGFFRLEDAGFRLDDAGLRLEDERLDAGLRLEDDRLVDRPDPDEREPPDPREDLPPPLLPPV